MLEGGSSFQHLALDHRRGRDHSFVIRGDSGPVRQLLTATPLILALAGCAPQPFDAASPWQPLEQDGEGRAYRSGLTASAPSNIFEEFEPGSPDSAAGRSEGPQSRVPDPLSGENPWATIPENPVVTICYGSALNNRAQVRETAKRLCPKGARPELIRRDTLQSDCPLLQPTRAAFRCWTDRRGAADASRSQ